MNYSPALYRLDGRVAVVTGGGGAIGGAICRYFAQAGAAVACLDANADGADRTAADITAAGGRALAIACNVADEGQTQEAVARTARELGSPTVLINVAAVMDRSGSVLDIDLPEWERVHSVNLTGAFLMSRALLPHMVRAGGGSIVHTSSILAHVGRAGRVSYASTKSALLQLARSMALDHASHNVRVNSLSPGPIDTERVRYRFANLSDSERAAIYARYPMRRMGLPEEVAACALFLASDAASFVNGSDLVVHGGSYGA